MNRKRRAPWVQWPPMGPMSAGDVAIVLRCDRRTVQLLAAAGELPGDQTWGGQWVFRRRDVEAYQKHAGGRLVPACAAIATKARPQLALRFPRLRRARPLPWGQFRMVKAGLRVGRTAKVADPKCDPKHRQFSKEIAAPHNPGYVARSVERKAV